MASLAAFVGVAWYDYQFVRIPLQATYAVQATRPPLAPVQQEVASQMFLAAYRATLPVHLAKVLELSSPRAVHSSTRLMLNGLLLSLHTSPDEQLALVLQQGYFGAGAYGISDASVAHLNKPLSSCSDYELASLVAMFKSPSAFTVGSDRLRRGAEVVLARYRNGT